MSPPPSVCVCAPSALHRWTAAATADLLSKIRNGGGNGSEASRSGSVSGALEGHWLGVKDVSDQSSAFSNPFTIK